MLYGGVSLAIYIYGVVLEFWRLVRASQGDAANAYTALLAQANLSATVDIISGASAGGINGILLGKALATGGDLRAVRTLWVEGAGIEKLLQPRSNSEPASLLRSDYFETLLREGLAEMDRLGNHGPLVDVLDLFAPGTRVRAALSEFRDDFGQTLQSKQFRKIFHLKFRRKGYNPLMPELGYDQDDFGAGQNETLIEVARSTSAFPAAFEPKKIAKEGRNARLFEDGEPDLAYFSDGGILHNHPFTEAISTISTRTADRPVRRWLLSVEPDPEHYTPSPLDSAAPEVLEVVSKALFGIPRYESIIGDLERLKEHRHRVADVRALLARVDRLAAADAADVAAMTDDEFETFLDSQMLYRAWTPLRGERAVDALAGWIADAANLDPDSTAIVLNAIDPTEPPPLEADPTFELRRISYLLGRLDELIARLPASERSGPQGLYQQLWGQFDRIQNLIWNVFSGDSPTAAGIARLRGASAATIGAVLTEILTPLREALASELGAVRASVASIVDELDRSYPRPAEIPFAVVFARFRYWDMFLLPVETLVGPARDPVRFVRISPAGATYIRKPVADKVAGDALGHFGGFLKREWRRSDILWGRLDAAETIVRLLFEQNALQTDVLAPSIELVQQEIVREEIPDHIPPPGQPWDYRTFLENDWRVGAETLADVPMQDRADLLVRGSAVLRNMLRRVAETGPSLLRRPFAWVGRALGVALMLLHWPVTAIWGRDSAARRFASLLILFIGGWSLVTTLLVGVFGVVRSTSRLWIWIGIGYAIFFLWSALLALAQRLRRTSP